ncbi:TPA: hypothetical protein QCX16_005007 [Bacillus toyonensis]|nr:hypothetical protein [Bacillus toyonensis]
MTNALVVIDYENLAGGARDIDLKLTQDGFKHFLDHLSNSYTIADGMLNVVCRFNDFSPGLQLDFEALSCETVDAIDLGKDVADGYVIIETITKLMENKDSIDEVVIVGGDNVYAGLVRTIVRKHRKLVKVISWKNSLADSLKAVNPSKVQLEHPEDIFKIDTNEHIGNGWLINDGCTELEFAVVNFVEKSKFKSNYEVHKLADLLVGSTDSRVANFNSFFPTKDWIFSQTGATGMFIKSRMGTKWYVKLNYTNPKVDYIVSRLPAVITKK